MVRVILLTALALSLIACGPTAIGAPVGRELADVPADVSPYFRQFYAEHGGMRILGQPISAEADENGVVVQYFLNTKLEYHPQMPEGHRVLMASLGADHYGLEPCIPAANAPAGLFLNECHSVSQEFQKFYLENGGASFFGYPISEQYIHGEWFAQNYERATVVWDPSQPPEYQFQLLALGLIACPETVCAARPVAGKYIPPDSTETPFQAADPILKFYEAHGAERVFGALLAGPRTGPDGKREIVYENGIIHENTALPSGAGLRPLGLGLLGAPEPAAPREPIPNGVYFAEYGHNVSLGIRDFFVGHGAESVFGYPISERRIDGNNFVQYFENAVFVMQLNLPVDQMVRLLDLGRMSLSAQPAGLPRLAPPKALMLATEPLRRVLNAPQVENQTLSVRVLDESGLPVSGASVRFVVYTPAGTLEHFAETHEDGMAYYEFRLAAYNPGEYVLYDAVVTYGPLTNIVRSQFMAWGVQTPS